ncbi:unnamed protein product [Somion occarium]|uniref:MYND-type domain-containing protein n=1 Tax=Somion occarium TaxID=3059160 RepID=A0ABP1E5N0_9APHY
MDTDDKHTLIMTKEVFRKILVESPRDVSRLVRDAHMTIGHESLWCMADLGQFLNAKPPMVAQLNVLCTTSLPLELLNILSDDHLYVTSLSEATAEEILDHYSYSMVVLSCLVMLVAYMRDDIEIGPHSVACTTQITTLLDRLPRYFEVVYSLLLNPAFRAKANASRDSNAVFLQELVQLASHMIYLSSIMRKPRPPSRHLGVVLLFCWKGIREPETHNACIPMLFRLTDGDHAEYALILEDALSCVSQFDEMLDDVLRALRSRKTPASAISALLVFEKAMFLSPRTLERTLALDSRLGTLLRSHTILHRRMHCYSMNYPDVFAARHLSYSVLSLTFQFIRPTNTKKEHLLKNPGFLRVLACDIKQAVSERWDVIVDRITSIISVYRTICSRANNAYRMHLCALVGPSVTGLIAYLREQMFRVTDHKKLAQTALACWVSLGETLGITSMPIDPPSSNYRPLLWKSCHNLNCICHDVKACHPLKICKGCWQVYYCSEKCQKLDWKQRHRATCRS